MRPLKELKRGEKMRFDDIFKEMEEFQKKMRESFFSDFDELKKLVETGELEGDWVFEPIEKPGVKGFYIQGSFGTPRPLDRPDHGPEPIKPMKPIRPMIDRPREPLYDLKNGLESVTLFVELPGVEEKNIKINPSEGGLELEAGNFSTIIKLPETEIDVSKMGKEYNNGVLTLTIPKTKQV